MQDQQTLRLKLAKIDAALQRQEQALLEAVLFECDLEEIISQEAIAIARAERKTSLVVFLCTLATHNQVEEERAQHWLDIYQSMGSKVLSPNLLKLSHHNALRLVISALIDQKPIAKESLHKVKGNGLMWLDAIDLAIDHHDWVSASSILSYLGSRPEETQTWLLIAKHLSQRHPLYVNQTGMQKVDVDYKALAKLYQYCASAAQNAGLAQVSVAIKQLQASALETAGDFDEAIKLLQSVQNKLPTSSVNVEIAKAQCKKGDLVAAIESMDRALLALANPSDQNEALANQFFEGRKAQASSGKQASFNTAKANHALRDLITITNNQQLDVFLVSGTLLGCIREGDFLGHDKDIDVGIVGWEQQFALCSGLAQSGLFTFDAQFLKGSDTYYLPVQHRPTGMWIDIFVYHPKGDKWVTGVDFFFGYRQTFSFTPFELQAHDFIGLDVLTPKNYSLNLEENFGAWQQPDPSYISHLESPSTDNKGALPFMLTARLSAYQAIVKKNDKKIQKILALMRHHQNKPAAMSMPVMQHLESIANHIAKNIEMVKLVGVDHD